MSKTKRDTYMVYLTIIIIAMLPINGLLVQKVKNETQAQAVTYIKSKLSISGYTIVTISEYTMYITVTAKDLDEFIFTLEKYRIDTIYNRGGLFIAFMPPVSERYPPVAYLYAPRIEAEGFPPQGVWMNP